MSSSRRVSSEQVEIAEVISSNRQDVIRSFSMRVETSSEFMSVIVCGNEVSVCSVKQGGLSDQSSQIIYVKVLTTQSEEISGANKTGERPPVIVNNI